MVSFVILSEAKDLDSSVASLPQNDNSQQKETFARASFAKSFFRALISSNPPSPPFKKGGNCKELLLKSPFGKGGFNGNAVHLTIGDIYPNVGAGFPRPLSINRGATNAKVNSIGFRGI
jgi:hypothetical protein